MVQPVISTDEVNHIYSHIYCVRRCYEIKSAIQVNWIFLFVSRQKYVFPKLSLFYNMICTGVLCEAYITIYLSPNSMRDNK